MGDKKIEKFLVKYKTHEQIIQALIFTGLAFIFKGIIIKMVVLMAFLKVIDRTIKLDFENRKFIFRFKKYDFSEIKEVKFEENKIEVILYEAEILEINGICKNKDELKRVLKEDLKIKVIDEEN